MHLHPKTPGPPEPVNSEHWHDASVENSITKLVCTKTLFKKVYKVTFRLCTSGIHKTQTSCLELGPISKILMIRNNYSNILKSHTLKFFSFQPVREGMLTVRLLWSSWKSTAGRTWRISPLPVHIGVSVLSGIKQGFPGYSGASLGGFGLSPM